MEPINLDNTKQLERIAEAVERIAVVQAGGELEPAGAEPAGVPILLIVEVLIALIKISRLHFCQPGEYEQLRNLERRLEHYQPVRPAWKEAE